PLGNAVRSGRVDRPIGYGTHIAWRTWLIRRPPAAQVLDPEVVQQRSTGRAGRRELTMLGQDVAGAQVADAVSGDHAARQLLSHVAVEGARPARVVPPPLQLVNPVGHQRDLGTVSVPGRRALAAVKV